ncbi:MAG: hypothetical protein ACYC5K_07740 [Saccharofermentanales bacterium]
MMKEGGNNLSMLLIAIKLFWKRKLTNIILMLQILLSVIMLSQVFVAIVDYQDNLRAVNELPIINTMVLTTFDYYDPEYVTQKILSSTQVDSVGRVYMSSFNPDDNKSCNLAFYNDAIISRYSPRLQSGSWLSDNFSVSGNTIPAVVSGDMGLKVGDKTDVRLLDEKTCQIEVVGILKKPAQYLYPSGFASPRYFTAASIISQDPVIILRCTDFDETSISEMSSYESYPISLFIFLKSGNTDISIDSIRIELGKYGEISLMTSLVSTFYKKTNKMIVGTTIMFVVFLLLAVTGVLSNNVIQSLRNRRQFTVYYLLGMDWKKSVVIEACRVGILIIITLVLCLIAGKLGWLMLEWMTPKRAFLFYGIVSLYIAIMFIAVGAGFLIKLIREDLSGALKDLQRGE